MDECYPDEGKKAGHRWGGITLLVSAAIVIVALAALFAVEAVQDIQNLSKFGTLEPAASDYLLNLIVMMLSIAILCSVIRDVMKGKSFFTSANAERFLIIGVLIILKIVMSIVIQLVIFSVYPHLNNGVVFPIVVVLSVFVVFILYYICKQGSRLQEDVDNIV
ncbi:MAG: hypothetical protein E7Z68_03020 [Thermoplasmata archaeon]|nr:hypothetical protein [Thermoplasmata archaeon]